MIRPLKPVEYVIPPTMMYDPTREDTPEADKVCAKCGHYYVMGEQCYRTKEPTTLDATCENWRRRALMCAPPSHIRWRDAIDRIAANAMGEFEDR